MYIKFPSHAKTPSSAVSPFLENDKLIPQTTKAGHMQQKASNFQKEMSLLHMGGQQVKKVTYICSFSRTATLWKATCPLFPVGEDLVKSPAAQVFCKNT